MKTEVVTHGGLALVAVLAMGSTSLAWVASCAGPTQGALSKAEIRGVIRSGVDAVSVCYRHRLGERPDLGEGRVTVELVIGPDGRLIDLRDAPAKVRAVSSALDAHAKIRVVTSDLDDPVVEHCVVRAFEALIFPRPRDGAVVAVRYPLRFSH